MINVLVSYDKGEYCCSFILFKSCHMFYFLPGISTPKRRRVWAADGHAGGKCPEPVQHRWGDFQAVHTRWWLCKYTSYSRQPLFLSGLLHWDLLGSIALSTCHTSRFGFSFLIPDCETLYLKRQRFANKFQSQNRVSLYLNTVYYIVHRFLYHLNGFFF